MGISSSSHAAIHNLLAEVERFAGEKPGWRGLKKHSGTVESHFRFTREEPLIENADDIADFAGGEHRLIAGTAWLFAREELDGTLDYLFVDEAGQIAVADALAIGTSARNLILLGDPLQLAQVSSLIAELGTLTRNTIRLHDAQTTFDKLSEPTPLQARALDLAATAPVDA